MYAFLIPERALTKNERDRFFDEMKTYDVKMCETQENTEKTFTLFAVSIPDEKMGQFLGTLMAVEVETGVFVAQTKQVIDSRFFEREASFQEQALNFYNKKDAFLQLPYIQQQRQLFEGALLGAQARVFNNIISTPARVSREEHPFKASLDNQVDEKVRIKPPFSFVVDNGTNEKTDTGCYRFSDAKPWDAFLGAESIQDRVAAIQLDEDYDLAESYFGCGHEAEDSVDVHRNILIVGPSGVGKTQMAKRIALDLAASLNKEFQPSAIMAEAPNLVGKFYNFTGNNVTGLLKAAAGEVLVIDEIDKFVKMGFTKESIGALVTHTGNHINSPLIVATLYKENLELFLQQEKGLKGRFPNIISVDGFDAEKLVGVFQALAFKENYHLGSDAKDAAKDYFTCRQISDKDDFSNARIAEQLWDKVKGEHQRSVGRFFKKEFMRRIFSIEDEVVRSKKTSQAKRLFSTIRACEVPVFDPTSGTEFFARTKKATRPRATRQMAVIPFPERH